MKYKDKFRKIIKTIVSKKHIYYPILAFLMVLVVGGVVLAGSLASNSKTSDRDIGGEDVVNAAGEEPTAEETSQTKETINETEKLETEEASTEFDELETEDDLDEFEGLEIIPDFEGDEIYIEETEAETKGSKSEDETKAPKPKKNPYYIKINKVMNTVTIYGLDENGNYSVPVKAMACSTGNATPLGKYNTNVKYRWKELIGPSWGQYSTRITRSFLFHSVPANIKSKDRVSYRNYNRLGETASAGCVRLTVIDAKWIFDNCPIGTTVEIYNDTSSPGPLGKPSTIKFPSHMVRNRGWDPTDPDPNNPWNKKAPSINLEGDTRIEKGYDFDIPGRIKALDTVGMDRTKDMKIDGTVDINTVGDYTVNYSITDELGRRASKDIVYSVVDTIAPVIDVTIKDNSIIPTNIGKEIKSIESYVEKNASASDKGDPNELKVDVKAELIKDSIWSYKVTIKAEDEAGNVGEKTLTLHDELSLNVSKKSKYPVKDEEEAIANTNVELVNKRTGKTKEYKAKDYLQYNTEEADNKIVVEVSYSDSLGRKDNKKVVFDITEKESKDPIDPADPVEPVEPGDTGDTGDPVDTGGTGDTGDPVDTGGTGDTDGSGDQTEKEGSGDKTESDESEETQGQEPTEEEMAESEQTE